MLYQYNGQCGTLLSQWELGALDERALREDLNSDNLRTLGFLFLDPFGLPRGRFITGAPSSWGFCGEKVNKHWWSILSWAKFSPQEMTSYSCMWPFSANFATTRGMRFIRNKLHSHHTQLYLGKVFSRPSSLSFPGHFRWQELFILSEFVHGFLCCFRCSVWTALFFWRHRGRITHCADCARTRKLFSVPCARREMKSLTVRFEFLGPRLMIL